MELPETRHYILARILYCQGFNNTMACGQGVREGAEGDNDTERWWEVSFSSRQSRSSCLQYKHFLANSVNFRIAFFNLKFMHIWKCEVSSLVQTKCCCNIDLSALLLFFASYFKIEKRKLSFLKGFKFKYNRWNIKNIHLKTLLHLRMKTFATAQNWLN